jgi:hypothetical protein
MKTTANSNLQKLERATPWRALFAGILLATPLAAQNFDNGSTGALGDVVIDADTTVPLPPDGILHYRSLRGKRRPHLAVCPQRAQHPGVRAQPGRRGHRRDD